MEVEASDVRVSGEEGCELVGFRNGDVGANRDQRNFTRVG